MLVGLFSWPLMAASISGQIEVMKKGARGALDSSDYALVYLTSIDKTLSAKPSDKPIVINQQGKRFFPRLMPIVKGQKVNFHNLDELEHNVFSTAEKNSFDLGRYPKGDFRQVSYDHIGKYKVYCNIHQKMILDIVVLDNHYFAVTDEQGHYRIDNVPKGDYQLNVWHIYGGTSSQKVTLDAQDLALPLTQIVSTNVVREVQKHKNKHGKNYSKRKGRYRR